MVIDNVDNAVECVLKEINFSSRTEACVTLRGDDWYEISAELRNVMAMRKAHLLSEFVFTGAGNVMTLNWNSSEVRSSWLRGDCCRGGTSYSTQAFILSGVSPRPVECRNETLGYVYEDEYAVYCNLSGITADNLHISPGGQTRCVLEKIESILNANGFKFNDIVRTWFFLDHLLDWYKEFNDARTDFYRSRGIFDKLVPASTGIGAANQDGSAVLCNLIAIKPKKDQIKIMTVASPMQDSPVKYHSTFSRAVEVIVPHCRHLMISGTASISQDGKTEYLDDAAKQIDKTMSVVHALLESRGMGWGDLYRGIAYFKNINDQILLEQYLLQHKIPQFPLAISHADVCRGDLLFEIEADASSYVAAPTA